MEVNLNLYPKQGQALRTRANEVLYGGAAGGGKSHLMRAASIIWCAAVPGLQVYLFRRIFDDLIKNHVEGPKGYRAMLAPWVDQGWVTIVESEIRFWNGSKIYLCHCQHEKDRFKYQGAEIHVLLLDEATHFTDTIYRFLRGRVRCAGLELHGLEGVFPRILLGSNPGNIGHHWVKQAFVDPDPMGQGKIWKTSDEEGGMMRQYIPARIEDNPSLETDDPFYRQRLRGLGSPELVRALELGDWGVIAGAFFPEFGLQHIIKPFAIPQHWLKFRAFDWGSARPFSVGWYAVADGEDNYPAGALIKYREWYGMQEGRPNIGLNMSNADIAKGILIREQTQEDISYSVADPACFTQHGGPSIIEQMSTAVGGKLIFRKADNTRQSGWSQLRGRLIGQDDQPMLYYFSTCVHSIRTLRALQHDEKKPEDVDTDNEDHAPDTDRYACQSRPWTRVLPPKPEEIRGYQTMTYNQLLKLSDKPRKRGRI